AATKSNNNNNNNNVDILKRISNLEKAVFGK
ncbi:MAG: cell division regulator GpsB, partial [Staphylococcus equorum]|nr:cell division regulator GpsB [Staphylococcus equorum]